MQAIANLNARIRSNKVLDYFCSTHFWGPVSNFGIPLAAIADFNKEPEIISGKMTGALVVYSAVFMRYSWGGKEIALKAKEAAGGAVVKAEDAASAAAAKIKSSAGTN
ncbi:hypothetical protein ABW20_dc0102109 [Dactylellina cionopaga]|nr:hypothetical protein ABW20_dc0102109 [Dactylellina cionopaga]